MIHIKFLEHKGLESMKNHITCTLIMNNGWIIVDFFCEESIMDEITCEMSPRISRGLGHEKLRSSTRSVVGLGHHTGLATCLSYTRFKPKQAIQCWPYLVLYLWIASKWLLGAIRRSQTLLVSSIMAQQSWILKLW